VTRGKVKLKLGSDQRTAFLRRADAARFAKRRFIALRLHSLPPGELHNNLHSVRHSITVLV
jgi:hypothetical protein